MSDRLEDIQLHIRCIEAALWAGEVCIMSGRLDKGVDHLMYAFDELNKAQVLLDEHQAGQEESNDVS